MNEEFIAFHHPRVEVMGPEALMQRYIDAIKGDPDPSSYMENLDVEHNHSYD